MMQSAMSLIWPLTLIMSLRIKCVRTVTVLERTIGEGSRRQAYILGVHGSKVFGHLKLRSPAAIIIFALMIGSGLLSKTVNNNCNCSSQNSLDTNMNLAKAKLAEALNFVSGYL